MIHYVALQYWILLVVGLALTVWLFRLAYLQQRFALLVLSGWVLAENALYLWALQYSPQTYSSIYFWSGLPEQLLMAAAAVSFGMDLIPRWRGGLMRYGPVVVVLPAFVALAVLLPVSLTKFMIFEQGTVLVAAFLLIDCILLEQDCSTPGAQRAAWCYLGFLALNCGASLIWQYFGITEASRPSPQIVYALGVSILIWGLKK